MDAFIKATAWHYFAFLKTGNGDIWRIWFGHDGLPMMEILTDSHRAEYREPIAAMLREKE